MFRSRSYLTGEFFALFVGLPVGWLLLRRVVDAPVPVIPALWMLSVVCLVVLLRDPTFDRRRLWRAGRLRREVPRILAIFAVLGAALAVLVLTTMPERLFGFARRSPRFWAVVMVLYPILSVYPQGIIYRGFVFHRYRRVVGDGAPLIVLSAAAFSLAHVVLGNGWAVVLTIPAGLLFAWTYHRTRSLLTSGLEHALYGDWVFTLGLGVYFYHGAAEAARRVAAG